MKVNAKYVAIKQINYELSEWYVVERTEVVTIRFLCITLIVIGSMFWLSFFTSIISHSVAYAETPSNTELLQVPLDPLGLFFGVIAILIGWSTLKGVTVGCRTFRKHNV